MTLIAPSLLSADFMHLEDDIRSVEQSGAHWLHLDIMDGHFVPNITFGPFIIKQMKQQTNLPLDAHLMIQNPTQFIPAFAEAGCDYITVHTETENHLHRTLQTIKSHGVKAGISVNPHTPLTFMPYVADLVDLVLIMTVNPGFGGQKYITAAAEKIAELDSLREQNNHNFLISVDGGVNDKTASDCISKGADVLVMGSHFFKAPKDQRKNIVKSICK